MSDDAVELTDLEVIQRWSLAVRSASADREEVVAALRADLAWLEGRRPRQRAADDDADEAPRRSPRRPTTARSAASTPARRTATKSASSRTAKSATKRTSTSRGGTRRR